MRDGTSVKTLRTLDQHSAAKKLRKLEQIQQPYSGKCFKFWPVSNFWCYVVQENHFYMADFTFLSDYLYQANVYICRNDTCTQCGEPSMSAQRSIWITYDCVPPIVGDVLKVVKNYPSHLGFCEVDIFIIPDNSSSYYPESGSGSNSGQGGSEVENSEGNNF